MTLFEFHQHFPFYFPAIKPAKHYNFLTILVLTIHLQTSLSYT